MFVIKYLQLKQRERNAKIFYQPDLKQVSIISFRFEVSNIQHQSIQQYGNIQSIKSSIVFTIRASKNANTISMKQTILLSSIHVLSITLRLCWKSL